MGNSKRYGPIHHLAGFAPLLAAIMAPFSTLMDVPALTQPWYGRDGRELKDLTGSIILSAVGLFFSIIANGLLLLRFSSTDNLWWLATRLSIVFWILKVAIALSNVLVFGRRLHIAPNTIYLEGFWCAVVGLIVSAGVVIFLLMHWVVGLDRKTEESQETKRRRRPISKRDIRVFGRHFMLQVTFFMFTVGICALMLSRIENWTYFEGLYFNVVTALTIGFGDFYPMTTAGRILLFPSGMLLLAQLATIIAGIASFIGDRMQIITQERQREYEIKLQEERDKHNPNRALNEEIQFLEKLYREIKLKHQIRSVLLSMVLFFCFWTIGALAFSQIEGWTYGDALYFCYVFFFAIGYGDFAPKTNGGRVFFVVYALIAVPIMTSFAVQTVISTMSYFANKRLAARGRHTKPRPSPEAGVKEKKVHWATFLPHGQLVLDAHKEIEETKSATLSKTDEQNDMNEALDKEIGRMLTYAAELENHARRLLVGHLCRSKDPDVSLAGNLLKADWNVQRREVLSVLDGESESDFDSDEDEEGNGDFEANPGSDIHTGVRTGSATLDEVKKYRVSFARFLASAASLQRLKGKKRLIFERRSRTIG